MDKDNRIKELELASMKLFDMVHEGNLIDLKCDANDLYDTIKPQAQSGTVDCYKILADNVKKFEQFLLKMRDAEMEELEEYKKYKYAQKKQILALEKKVDVYYTIWLNYKQSFKKTLLSK